MITVKKVYLKVLLTKSDQKFFSFQMPRGCDQRRLSGGQCFWWVLQDVAVLLVGQDLSERLTGSSSRRVVVATWLIFCYVVVSIYNGNLTASLTLPKPPPRAQTVAQLDAATDRSFTRRGIWSTFTIFPLLFFVIVIGLASFILSVVPFFITYFLHRRCFHSLSFH